MRFYFSLLSLLFSFAGLSADPELGFNPPYTMKACFGGAFDNEYPSLMISVGGTFLSGKYSIFAEIIFGHFPHDNRPWQTIIEEANNYSGCVCLAGKNYIKLTRTSDPRYNDGYYQCNYQAYSTSDDSQTLKHIGWVQVRFFY